MVATPIRFVMADAPEAARTKSAEATSRLAADVNAAAEAFENVDRLLRLHFPDPIVARAQGALPQRPGSAQQHAGSMHVAAPRRFNMLGFLVGVALSAAIGTLVCIYLALR